MKEKLTIEDFKFGFYKEMYLSELDNKEKINSRISIPLGIVTLLIGGGVYFLEQYSILNGTWKIIYLINLIIYFLSLFFSIIYLARAYYNYEYKYLPKLSSVEKDTKALERYVDECIVYRGNPVSDEERDRWVKDEVYADINKKFTAATDNNMALNEKKLFYLRKVGIWLLVTIVIGAFSFIPTTLGNKTNQSEVEIQLIIEGGNKSGR